jgi:DNA-binding NarL/FixJ family response regulator
VDDVRILLVDMPRMLREIIQNVVDAHPGVTVAGVHPQAVPLVAAVDAVRADVVIFGQDSPGLVEAGRELIEQRPRVQLMAVSDDGRRATLSGLRPYREPLGEVEPSRLVEAIRGMAATAAVW